MNEIRVKNIINNCLLPKLAKTDEECEDHNEYKIRMKNLDQNFINVLNCLGEIDMKKEPKVLASLKILYEELVSNGPWNTNLTEDYAKKLNGSFDMQFGISLKKLFSSDIFDCQELFANCIKILNEKIRVDNFKYYPSLVEVYYLIVHNVKEHSIPVNATCTLPISLYLIDDYDNKNRTKGLKCCVEILNCLSPGAFSEGNYYEVIYRSLKNKAVDKDVEVTKLVLDCILRLLTILPENIKFHKTDDILTVTLEQLYTEPSLYRKAVFFNFLKNIIDMHGVNCVKKKQFNTIFCDNIDVCCNDAVAEVLLGNVLECLEAWVKHCWCVWRLSSDKRILCLLIKLLYVSKEEPRVTTVLHLIIALINVCSRKEQEHVYGNLKASKFSNLKFERKLEIIIKEIR